MMADEGYIQDFAIDESFTSPGRTITETDLVNYLGLSAFFEEVFYNATLARDSVFGRRVVPTVLILALAEGLFVLSGRLTKGVAFLSLTDLVMHSPAAVGDMLTVTLRVKSTRLTSKPGRGILEMHHAVHTEDARLVMEYVSSRMMLARD